MANLHKANHTINRANHTIKHSPFDYDNQLANCSTLLEAIQLLMIKDYNSSKTVFISSANVFT